MIFGDVKASVLQHFVLVMCDCRLLCSTATVRDSNFPLFLRHVVPSTSQQLTNRKAGPFVFLVWCAEGLVIWNMEVNMLRNYELGAPYYVHRYGFN